MLTKKEIIKLLKKLEVAGYSVRKDKIVVDVPNMGKIADEIISKLPKLKLVYKNVVIDSVLGGIDVDIFDVGNVYIEIMGKEVLGESK